MLQPGERQLADRAGVLGQRCRRRAGAASSARGGRPAARPTRRPSGRAARRAAHRPARPTPGSTRAAAVRVSMPLSMPLSVRSQKRSESCRKPIAGFGSPDCGYTCPHGPHSPLARAAVALHEAEDGVRVAVLPAADHVHRHLDVRVVLAHRAVLPELVAALMARPRRARTAASGRAARATSRASGRPRTAGPAGARCRPASSTPRIAFGSRAEHRRCSGCRLHSGRRSRRRRSRRRARVGAARRSATR